MGSPLNEKELLMGTALTPSGNAVSTGGTLASSFPTEFPYEFDSVLELESGEDSAEEVAEDAFFAGLTRRLTQQNLAAKPERKRTVVGSPESTLCGKGSCWSVSSNGSPNSAPSPPTTPFGSKDDTLELIHAAAGEIARLKMATRNTTALGGTKLHGVAPSVMDPLNPNPSANPRGYFIGQNSSYRASQYQKLSQLAGQRGDQLLKQEYGYLLKMQQPQHQVDQTLRPLCQQHFHFRGGSGLAFGNANSGRPVGVPPSTWSPPHLYQQRIGGSAAGMRSIYPGGSVGVKRERAGTGVFLPRKYGTNPTPDSGKKKTGGSPVLPSRAVQALNLNMDDRNMQGVGHARPSCGLVLSDYDIVMARRAAILAQRKQSLRPEVLINNELRLPQEWTY